MFFGAVEQSLPLRSHLAPHLVDKFSPDHLFNFDLAPLLLHLPIQHCQFCADRANRPVAGCHGRKFSKKMGVTDLALFGGKQVVGAVPVGRKNSSPMAFRQGAGRPLFCVAPQSDTPRPAPNTLPSPSEEGCPGAIPSRRAPPLGLPPRHRAPVQSPAQALWRLLRSDF